MRKSPKPLDDVDWEEASQHLIGAFPGVTLGEVVERAENAATVLDLMRKPREAEAMRRSAAHIRKKMAH
ncbi:hypothetical protein [Caulobacter sp. UNC279MFTsu5.1]|uniref:hypothetical protein n=1 Tax=Caulobacter sp. UNC279MFTsu5.1 TaxID=1502775 RepID=UPI0008E155F9|nr:hypothetical protein [Caulobacter sp. UNC279MFTsu5.1]SFI54875.1 hypothetical protein SAMN02799626_00096 [Caulobacter sp. UNC279MFTsu5.1]